MKHILAASESMPRSIFKNFLFSHSSIVSEEPQSIHRILTASIEPRSYPPDIASQLSSYCDVRVRCHVHVHVHVQPLLVLAPSSLGLSPDPRWCTVLLRVARNITYK